MRWSELTAEVRRERWWPVGTRPGWRFSPRRDLALPVVVLLVQLIGLHFAARGQHQHLSPAALLLACAAAALLPWRRRWPVAVAAGIFGITLTYSVAGYPHGPIFLAMVIAFVALVQAGYRALALGLLVVGYLGFLWLPILAGTEPVPPVQEAAGVAAWLLVLGAASETARARGQIRADAELAREQGLRRRASEERLQIAREVHDVLAHSISVINVQAGVGLHLMQRRPEQAAEALATIKTASAEALQELRGLLGVLRQDPREPAPRAPAPGIDRLDGLVASAAATGVGVTVEVHGARRPLPVQVEHAAYRIVQEALTNVARYARPPVATVRVHYAERDLIVRVDDGGTGVGASVPVGSGTGIAGMRERATALGGIVTAGPRPGGGFRVEARLPVPPAPVVPTDVPATAGDAP